MKKPAILCLTAILTSGCVTAASSPPAPAATPVVEPARVPLKLYSSQAQAGLADALGATAPGSPLRTFTADYGQLRRAVCAAEGWRQPACRQMRGS
jgi:hypothetical protein